MRFGISWAHRWLARAGWSAALGVVLLSGSSVFAQTLRDGIRQAFVVTVADDSAANAGASEYWIGVVCADVPAALRAHLELPENQGVLLADVANDGPAAKAGLKQHDLLLAANDKPLTQAQDLVAAVSESEGAELNLRLLRGGKEQTIAVKPEKRPDQGLAGGGAAPEGDERAVFEWFRRNPVQAPWRMRFFNPGMVLPPGAPAQAPLPNNMSVAIAKQGGEPAKVVVKQEDKTWETTEDKLQELPDDVRGHVERLLGRGPQMLEFNAIEPPKYENVIPAQPYDSAPARARARRFGGEDRTQQQLEELRKQIESLQNAVEKLQKPE